MKEGKCLRFRGKGSDSADPHNRQGLAGAGFAFCSVKNRLGDLELLG